SSFFFSSRRRHTRSDRDWSSDVCSSDLDFLRFLVDGAEVMNITGEADWRQQTYTISSGLHDIGWIYSKDPVCCTGGSDRGWLDRSEERRVGKEVRARWWAGMVIETVRLS